MDATDMMKGWRRPTSSEEDKYIRGRIIKRGLFEKRIGIFPLIITVVGLLVAGVGCYKLLKMFFTGILEEDLDRAVIFLILFIMVGLIAFGFAIYVISAIADNIPKRMFSCALSGEYELIDVDIDRESLDPEGETAYFVHDKYGTSYGQSAIKRDKYIPKAVPVEGKGVKTDGLLFIIKDTRGGIISACVVPKYDENNEECIRTVKFFEKYQAKASGY